MQSQSRTWRGKVSDKKGKVSKMDMKINHMDKCQ